MKQLLGQILPETPLGMTLTTLAREAETIVETGTWNGQGSTVCLRLGLLRPSQRIWTVESNEARHAEAKAFHADEPRITFLLGTVVTGDEILPAYEEDLIAFTSEVAQNNIAPLVVDQLPKQIDLLFVDGGAFSGFAEVSKLHSRCKDIVMDDVFDSKNDRSYGMLCYKKDWKLMDVSRDRNGWAWFRREAQ